MILAELIEELKSKGIRLGIRENRLTCVAPPGALDDRLRQQIQERKEELVEILNAGKRSANLADPIRSIENQTSYPLSSSQRRTRMTTPTGASLPAAFLLDGELNREHLEKVLNYFVSRHSTLRSSFILDGRESKQIVQDYIPFSVPFQSVEQDDNNAIERALDQLQKIELDPANGVCFHFEVIRLSGLRHILFACFSPVVFDGWSFDLFWQELSNGYTAMETQKEWKPLPLAYSFADCSNWLLRRIKDRKKDLDNFWHQHLGDELPLDVFPVLEKPDADRTTVSLPLELAPNVSTAVKEFARTTGSTPQAVLLAAVYIWSSGLRGEFGTDQDQEARDVVLGIAVEGRPEIALETVVGPFANLILLRQGVSPAMSFSAYSQKVRNEFLEAHQHQEYPVDWHQIRSRPGSTRSFQIEYSFQQTTGRSSKMGSLDINQLELRSGTSAVDLTFWVKDWGDRISGAVEFRAGAFRKAEIEQWIECYFTLLERLLAHPELPVGSFPLLSPEQARQTRSVALENGVSTVQDKQGNTLPFGVPGYFGELDGLHILRHDGSIEPVHENQEGNSVLHVVPKSDMETRLELILRNIIGVPVGTETNIFDAGLNSLQALRFVNLCQEELAAVISLPQLFSFPTISQLADQLELDIESIDAKTTVSLQPVGNQPPIYCICGINLYQPLASAMGEDQPTHAIYIPNEHELLSENDSYSVEDLAGVYWEVIKENHSGGPLSLLGFCFGGALAYEIGKLAIREGIDVPKLIFVDTALSHYMTRRLPSRLAQHLSPRVKRGVKKVLGKSTVKEDQILSEQAIEMDRATALSSRLDSFSPTEVYAGDTIMVDSGDSNTSSTWIKTPMMGWEEILTGEIAHVKLNATHGTVLNEKNSREIAAQLSALMNPLEVDVAI